MKTSHLGANSTAVIVGPSPEEGRGKYPPLTCWTIGLSSAPLGRHGASEA
jgi:hypothetical protein